MLKKQKSPFLRNLTFGEGSLQMGPQIDSDFVFYRFISCIHTYVWIYEKSVFFFPPLVYLPFIATWIGSCL